MVKKFHSAEEKAAWEEDVRTKLSSVEQQASSNPKHHYRMRPDVGIQIVDARLSPTAMRLWIYLCTLFPFGDRPTDLPSQPELALRLGVSRQSILTAASELNEAGLWDFHIDRWKGRNLTGHGFQGSKKFGPSQKNLAPVTENLAPVTENLAPVQNFLTPLPVEPLCEEGSRSSQTIQTIQTLSDSHPPALSERDECLFIGEEPIDEYREWLLRRAAELPKPPALIEVWLEKQSQKKANQKAFLKFKKTREMTVVPSAPAPQNFEQEELTPEQRLEKYQSMWKFPPCRRGIEEAIAAHPEWGMRVGATGPEWVTTAGGV